MGISISRILVRISLITQITCSLLLVVSCFVASVNAQPQGLEKYNIKWTTQSKNSSESMPCGGNDVGLNVWVEKGEIMFYVAQSGAFDENNALLKAGRVRIKLTPNPFDGNEFSQELILKDGSILIKGADGNLKAEVEIYVNPYHSIVDVNIKTNRSTKALATFESWRFKHSEPLTGRANNANSWKWAPQGDVRTWKDSIAFIDDAIWFHHRNRNDKLVFDATVKQQGLDSVKDQLFNPLKDLTSGGIMTGTNMKPAGTITGKYIDTEFKGWQLLSSKATRSHNINIYLGTEQVADLNDWGSNVDVLQSLTTEDAKSARENFWKQFWHRSFIFIEPNKPNEQSEAWQSGRNYQLFRYMLACNAHGDWPTKFNGGLFTYDPVFIDTSFHYTPDFRNWGGGTHTAQNQRLVYFPMLKSGDFYFMESQFEFYNRILKNAELRSKIYWNHEGACFTEQMENFGLPNPAEYAWNRPANFDKGVEYNAWLEYEWDTVLEFCFMILESERYNTTDITEYIPLIKSCLKFFDAHYQYLAKQRGRRPLDGNGHLILYPGSGAETFKMAYNSTSTIAALKTVTQRMLDLPEKYLDNTSRKSLDSFLRRIPPISFTNFNGHTTIAPAIHWERINNVESPQLYPVFPWGIFGIDKPGYDTALNTWKYDTNVIKFRSHIGWKQDNIFAARLGLTEDAAKLTFAKLKNSGRKFPAFWGPGFDWTPDHNWGGSGMIGLQEMLMQVDGKKIILFPAWPKNIDVHFKLHAPYETTVEAKMINGKAEIVDVQPANRKTDIIIK